jgi:lipoic acid synthetase
MGAEAGAKERMPLWLRRRVRCGPALCEVERVLTSERLNTVCDGARCPNRGECYSSGTATFMIMGEVCARGCRFCAVPGGRVEPLRKDEPEAVARAASSMGLSHVVVTSVARDDLPDGGAAHFARTVEEVRRALPGATVEVLVPDFLGDGKAVETVIQASPDVFNHNVETVARLYGKVRPEADYGRSLAVLAQAAGAGLRTKSGFMVGLGERDAEVAELLSDLRGAGCSSVTSGQYMQPTADNVPVVRYWEPAEFERIESLALALGFESVSAGPFVRSSYHAAEMLRSEGRVDRR